MVIVHVNSPMEMRKLNQMWTLIQKMKALFLAGMMRTGSSFQKKTTLVVMMEMLIAEWYQRSLIDLHVWDGVILDTNFSGTGEMFRAAVLALSSDIPATRKCGGFVGHNAKKAEHIKMHYNEGFL